MQPQIVFITAGTSQEAETIARALVGERLAACANVVPAVTSIYRWEGKVQRDPEVLLIVKSTDANMPALIQRVKELHSYQVPEIIALPIAGGSPEYLVWILEACDVQMNKT